MLILLSFADEEVNFFPRRVWPISDSTPHVSVVDYRPLIRNDDGFQTVFYIAGNVYTDEGLSKMLKVNKAGISSAFLWKVLFRKKSLIFSKTEPIPVHIYD